MDSANLSPFPLFIQCPDYAFAQFVALRLEPWFQLKKNWNTGTPHAIALRFVDSAEFKDIAHAFECRQALIWSVKQGRRTGLFCHKYTTIVSQCH